MMKHFPAFKLKFTPDAVAHTVAPSKWNVLLSQRRRWINSTVHNLVELMFLPELCGFCCFSMRFVVFVDLLGTIVGLREIVALTLSDPPGYMWLCEYPAKSDPSLRTQLVYLIVVVSTGKAAIPFISLAMIGAVYGLQVRYRLHLMQLTRRPSSLC